MDIFGNLKHNFEIEVIWEKWKTFDNDIICSSTAELDFLNLNPSLSPTHNQLISLARIILDLILFDCPALSKIAILFNQKSLTDVKTSFSDNVESFCPCSSVWQSDSSLNEPSVCGPSECSLENSLGLKLMCRNQLAIWNWAALNNTPVPCWESINRLYVI